MPRKVRVRARVNTGLTWFFRGFDPRVLLRPHREKAERERKAKLAHTEPSSTNPRRLARLRRRKKLIRLKQLKE